MVLRIPMIQKIVVPRFTDFVVITTTRFYLCFSIVVKL